MDLLDGVIGKVRCYSAVLQVLGTQSVTEQLASFLLLHATGDGRPGVGAAQLGQSEIARVVGATRQWVSSALDRFCSDGLIDIDTKRRIKNYRSKGPHGSVAKDLSAFQSAGVKIHQSYDRNQQQDDKRVSSIFIAWQTGEGEIAQKCA